MIPLTPLNGNRVLGFKLLDVARETCEKGATRSSGFDIPKPSNFGPRTLARPAPLA
jgi:hypothetical protein